MVTTSRGVANSLPIAEYAVAGMLHFAMGFHRAAIDRDAGAFHHRAYRPLLVQGKTACVVGDGGIGTEVSRLCAALGMRVVGTRRQPQPARSYRKASAKSAGRRLSTGFCRKAISSRFAVNGPRRPPGYSTKTASRR